MKVITHAYKKCCKNNHSVSPPSVQGGGEGILDFFQLRGGKKNFERQGTFRVGKLNFPDFQGGKQFH